MKFIAYAQGGCCSVGELSPAGDAIYPIRVDSEAVGVLPLVIAAADGGRLPQGDRSASIPLDDVSVRAPIPRPRRNIFCVGKNYFDHAHEFARSGFDSSAAAGAVPGSPIIFSKVPECVIADGEDVVIDPAVTAAVDYEAELAVIIGRGGRGISKASAMDHVWGYTIVNDVTARDLQGRHKQWLIGKSLDTFCPMGPVAVTADELDLQQTGVRCYVNGELRQNAMVSQLIFDIPTLIETLSSGITLYPGDVIATGTPAGVGIGFDPPRYLQVGDEVTVEIDGIGRLHNRFAAIDRHQEG
ncbi:2-keto-4-pentenoate hydratase/2-oxohepta-3-ene-1,7-dioic acid hydratase in catechol pathway [Natronocella acetinitrilica]|uniref:2-keto-4-pentenoate hydratase/2-oxohepta-3-ene-1,7-dioic acid hydratase in catechol pathway n=1 Tax=Natronocella acetinitrilica TaxID=414046 RepID=A0AAE3G2V1_9GAMM|nr:fumarylacetoacetate hydrolase family protein [Natronocella acetinitrilica]MCP1674815.1 2-keto-4-pentenoate hydratase/2-oxohepta-3-ene-1,7-dioic acid hydratase in catechol pathway [Natronocella acetinitrilica]